PPRKVYDPVASLRPLAERSAIGDAHGNTAVVSQVRHANHGAEGELAMGRRHLVLAEDCAAGGPAAVEVIGVEGGFALHLVEHERVVLRCQVHGSSVV